MSKIFDEYAEARLKNSGRPTAAKMIDELAKEQASFGAQVAKIGQQQAEPRTAFEATETARGNDVSRDTDGLYTNQFVQERWEGFASAVTVAEPKAGQHCVRCGGTFGGWCDCSDNRAACARQQVEQYLASSDPEGHRQSIIDHEAEQQAEPGEDERAAFVDWMRANRYDVGAFASGEYHNMFARNAWMGWQARAAQSGQRAGVAEGYALVPVEPTGEMRQAAYDAFIAQSKKRNGLVEAYRAALAAAPTQQEPRLSDAARDVFLERVRQQSEEGWTPEHDDEHGHGQMATAAGCYAMFTAAYPEGDPPRYWPWAVKWWKPRDPRRNLVKAGALILAEIERLDRAAAPTPAAQQEGGE